MYSTSLNVFYRIGSTVSTSVTGLAPSAISGTAAMVNGLMNETQYAFVVTAVGPSGESGEWGGDWDAITTIPSWRHWTGGRPGFL